MQEDGQPGVYFQSLRGVRWQIIQGAGELWKIGYIWEIDQINMLRIMGARFLITEEEIYKYEKRNRMNLVILDWNGKCQCELMDLNILDR